MEYTGTYYEPIANALHNAGIFVSVVNPLLIDDYGTNRVRRVKTDKKDAFKIANYALEKWTQLREYIPAEDTRKTLKVLNRQYTRYNKILVMQKNSLIALLDSCFPNANIHSSPLLEGNLTVTKNGLILFCNFPILIAFPSFVHLLLKRNI